MALNVILANGVRPTVTSVQTLFTSPASGAGTRIIAFTATNNAVGTETYSVYIVPSGGSADDTNRIINVHSLATLLEESPSGVQNQLIPSGGTLRVAVSTGTTIAFRGAGISF